MFMLIICGEKEKKKCNLLVISDLQISNRHNHCNTDRNIVQSQLRVGGRFSVVVYASLPALRHEKINKLQRRERKEDNGERHTQLLSRFEYNALNMFSKILFIL